MIRIGRLARLPVIVLALALAPFPTFASSANAASSGGGFSQNGYSLTTGCCGAALDGTSVLMYSSTMNPASHECLLYDNAANSPSQSRQMEAGHGRCNGATIDNTCPLNSDSGPYAEVENDRVYACWQ